MVTENKEPAGAEVAVELQKDVIGHAGDGLLGRAAAELTQLWRCLVRAVPTRESGSVHCHAFGNINISNLFHSVY